MYLNSNLLSCFKVKNICISPDGRLMVCVDMDGRAMIINKNKGIVLNRIRFKGPIQCIKFSPNGRFIAVGMGRLL